MKKLYLNMNKELVCVNPIVEYSAVAEGEGGRRGGDGGRLGGHLSSPEFFRTEILKLTVQVF